MGASKGVAECLNPNYQASSRKILNALLPTDLGAIINDIKETQVALRAQKGFGSFSVTTQELLLFAAALVSGEYTRDEKDSVLEAAVSTSITNIILAQYAAMFAVICGSAVAAASS